MEEAAEHELRTAVANIKKYEEKALELERRIRKLEADRGDVSAIEELDIEGLLTQIRDLLNQDVARAAEVLNLITGPVVVHQQAPKPGRRGATWVATFKVNLVKVVAELSNRRITNCPTTCIWDQLNTCSWIFELPCEVVLEKPYKYETIAKEMKELLARGTTIEAIASLYRMSWTNANRLLRYAETGELPRQGIRNSDRKVVACQTGRKPVGKGAPWYQGIADLVANLRDNEKMPFPRIAEQVEKRFGESVSIPTVKRAYDFAHDFEFRTACQGGEPFQRGRHWFLGGAKHRQIESLLKAGMIGREIANRVGCHVSTVNRKRKEMRLDGRLG